MKKEVIAGLFLLVGLVVFGLSILLIKDIKLQKGYRINLYFNDVGNLMERAWVRMRGVKIGRVEKILIEEDKAKVIIWVDTKSKLYKGLKARITSTGVLGVKYIEIIQGDPNKGEVVNGEDIYNTEEVVSIDDMLSTAAESLSNFGDFLSKISKEESISQKVEGILKNIEEFSKKLNYSINEQELKTAIKNLSTAGESINDFLEGTKSEVKNATLTLKDVATKLDEIIENIKSTQTVAGQIISDKESGKNVAQSISSLKTVLEKADMTLNRINMFTTYWDYKTRYDTKNNLFKGDVGIEIYPRDTKFYYLSVNNISTGEENSLSGEKVNTFSIGIGGTFYKKISVYGGIIRSYAGVGLRLFPLGYKSKLLEFNVEAYNFSRARTSPQLDLGLKLKLLKWLYLGARYEDVSISKTINAMLSVNFEDKDVAYLLGLIGLTQ